MITLGIDASISVGGRPTSKYDFPEKVPKKLSDLENDLSQPDFSQNDPNRFDYIKNRTHYEETVWKDFSLNTEVLEIQGFTMPDAGEKITIKIDGIETEETVKTATSEVFGGIPYIYIGTSDFDSIVSGGTGWCILSEDGGVGVSNPDITISLPITVVHQIADKFVNTEGVARTFGYYFKNPHIATILYDDSGRKVSLYTIDENIIPSAGEHIVGTLSGSGLMVVSEAYKSCCLVKCFDIQDDGSNASVYMRHFIFGTNIDNMKQLAADYGYTHTTDPTA